MFLITLCSAVCQFRILGIVIPFSLLVIACRLSPIAMRVIPSTGRTVCVVSSGIKHRYWEDVSRALSQDTDNRSSSIIFDLVTCFACSIIDKRFIMSDSACVLAKCVIDMREHVILIDASLLIASPGSLFAYRPSSIDAAQPGGIGDRRPRARRHQLAHDASGQHECTQ